MSFILEQLVLFFSDDGDGVPYVDLIGLAGLVGLVEPRSLTMTWHCLWRGSFMHVVCRVSMMCVSHVHLRQVRQSH